MAFKWGLEYNFLREWIFLISSDGAPCAEGRVVYMCVCVCLFWKKWGWDEFICRFPPHLSTCHCRHVCFEAADGEAASRKRTTLLGVFSLLCLKFLLFFCLRYWADFAWHCVWDYKAKVFTQNVNLITYSFQNYIGATQKMF